MEDVFSRLLNLTSHISRRFVQFIEDLVFREMSIFPGRLVGVSGGSSQFSSSYTYTSCIYNSEACSSSPSTYSDNTRFVVHDIETTDLDRHFYANSRPVILVTNYGCRGIHSILKGLFLPLFGLRFAWRLALATWRFYFSYIRSLQCGVRRAICRMKRTLHGSSDEIGWLQRDPGMPPVIDGSDRFEELLLTIRNGEHRLPDSYIYLLIPGLFSNHGPLYFVSTKKFFSKMGLACHIAKIHSEASVEHNALELKHYIEELYWGSGKSVMLLGHSKGGVDAAAALTLYWSDLKEKVAGLALVQSPYGGSPLASDIFREGQIVDRETRRIMELFICRIVKGDIRALEDLTYEKRKEFIKNHELPLSIPLISFHSEASVGLAVIGTMTHIAQAELPRIPFLTSNDCNVARTVVVPVVVPVAAMLALCALHLRLRYGEKSDGMVTRRDAEVPGSVVVRPRRKLDHAWMVYSSWKEEEAVGTGGAREMCEALFTMLVEIGKKKMKMIETK